MTERLDHTQGPLQAIIYIANDLTVEPYLYLRGEGGYCWTPDVAHVTRDAAIAAGCHAIRRYVTEVQRWDIGEARFAGLVAWLEELACVRLF